MSRLGQSTPSTYGKAAPRDYKVGAGRGAVGFTTRSDIGPADSLQVPLVAPMGYVAGAGRGATGMGDSGSSALMGAVPGAGITGVCGGVELQNGDRVLPPACPPACVRCI